MLSVKFYRNLRRNLFYRIYFNKFQKCDHWFGNTFIFCTDIPFAVHFNCAEKILHLREEHKHMTIVRIFIYLSLKYISYFHNIIIFYGFYKHCWCNFFLYFFCQPEITRGEGGCIWVVLLHYCIHTYKIICFINT